MQRFGHRALNFATQLLAATFIVGGLTFLSTVEGEWYPIVRNVEVTDAHWEAEKLRLHLAGSFEKVRGNCTILNISFWEVIDGVHVPLEKSSDSTIILLPKGGHTFGPWQLEGYTNRGPLKIGMVHHCHFLYDTDSVFYRGHPVGVAQW